MSALPALDLSALRELIERRFPDATPVTHLTAKPVSSGVPGLDKVLPSGGFPRGRLTAWLAGTGAHEGAGGAATALLTAACRHVAMRGERAAWIDGASCIAGDYWHAGPLLLRPRDRLAALRSADELLRSSGFALVVLAGAAPGAQELVRLSRAAREGGGAFVALTAHAATAGLRVASRVLPEGYLWRCSPFGDPAMVDSVRVRVRTESLGWSARGELVLPVAQHRVRLALEPAAVDRRGVLVSGRCRAGDRCGSRGREARPF